MTDTPDTPESDDDNRPERPAFDGPQIAIEEEMKASYLDYAMSVIVSRAIPDLRDGLKPVHRRILYAMHETGNSHDKSYRKSARPVGDVMGKYHPHGDSAIYDALVRMAQDFSMSLPLLDGQGNFGSMDGDNPAAMRYTEVRMDKPAASLLADIEKDTVDFQLNYDGKDLEPSVLPARYPNMLVNGAGGIAVGMATNIPPHNLGEVIDATLAIMEEPDLDNYQLMEYIPAPDFPTGGIILGRSGAKKAYTTGRGSVIMRAKTRVEEIRKDRFAIVLDEIPYQVNKSSMIEKIAEMAREKKIEGIAHVQDESDRVGVRVVVELKRDATPEVVLNQLFRFTPMQTSFGCNLLALNGGKPEQLDLRKFLTAFVDFREEVVARRTAFELKKARERSHILCGLAVAVTNVDEIVATIRASAKSKPERSWNSASNASPKSASKRSRTNCKNWPERSKTTLISSAPANGSCRSSNPNSKKSVSYIKRTVLDEYRAQKRGGKGVGGMSTKDDDFITNLFVANTHTPLLFFTTDGMVYKLKTWRLPPGGRNAKGKAIVNILPIPQGVSIAAINDVMLVTNAGKAIRFSTTDVRVFQSRNSTGVRGIKLPESVDVVSMSVIRHFEATPEERTAYLKMRRQLAGVDEEEVEVDAEEESGEGSITHERYLEMLAAEDLILTLTEQGAGKLSSAHDYPVRGRGGMGVTAMDKAMRGGPIVASFPVSIEDQIMLVTDAGQSIRTPVEDISFRSRSAGGVKVFNTKENEKVVSVAWIAAEEEDEDGDNGDASGESAPE